jgi:drug/metabolite transporter (DMT)-like permease
MSARTWTIFAAVSTLWGIPYMFIKIAVNGGVTPGVLAWGRVALASVVLLSLARRSGSLRDLRGRWRWLGLYGLVEISIPFPLIAAGEEHISSSLAAIIIATVPLLVALLALRFDPAERATGTRLVGLFTGLLGVIALVGIDASGKLETLLGAGAVLLAAAGYAAGPMIFKRHLADLDPRATMGASLAVAAVILTPVALLDAPSRTPSLGAVGAVVVLGLVCTALAFALVGLLISEIGPARAAVITYINPVIAVALGVTFLGEQPGAGAVAGLLLILAGSWLSTDGRLPPGLTTLFRRSRRDRALSVDRPIDGPWKFAGVGAARRPPAPLPIPR